MVGDFTGQAELPINAGNLTKTTSLCYLISRPLNSKSVQGNNLNLGNFRLYFEVSRLSLIHSSLAAAIQLAYS